MADHEETTHSYRADLEAAAEPHLLALERIAQGHRVRARQGTNQLFRDTDAMVEAALDRLGVERPPRFYTTEIYEQYEHLEALLETNRATLPFLLAPVNVGEQGATVHLMQRQGLAATVANRFEHLARFEADVADVEMDDLQHAAHPFMSNPESSDEEKAHLFGNEDPYRRALIPFSHTDITPYDLDDEGGKFTDWGLGLREEVFPTFKSLQATVLFAEALGREPAIEFDRFRVHMILAATLAKTPQAGVSEAGRDMPPSLQVMQHVLLALESMKELVHPTERIRAQIMLEKAFHFVYWENANQSMRIVGRSTVAVAAYQDCTSA
jgi:hypothetical protein